MTTLLLIVWILVALSLIAPLAIHPERSKRSWFELKRRGDEATMRRERHFETVVRIRVVLMLCKVSVLTFLSFLLWQGWGVVVTIAFIVVATPIARLAPVRGISRRLYARIESKLLDAVEASSLLRWLMTVKRFAPKEEKLESQDQLHHLVESSLGILDGDQRKIILSGLNWHRTPVSSVMTKRQDIVSVKYTELLGPLVLDDLHRTGHTRFPVIKGTLDVVVGMLDISELLEIDAGRKSATVEKVMHPQALRIEADESLPAALALLQKSHQHVLIVIDGEGKTVGLVTLSDITGSLLG